MGQGEKDTRQGERGHRKRTIKDKDKEGSRVKGKGEKGH